jgi:hypothetical protein
VDEVGDSDKYWTLETVFNKLSNPDEISKGKRWVIAEIAGKDSIAAVIKALELNQISRITGIGINHRGFFGNFQEPIEHFLQLENQFLQKSGIEADFFYLNIENLFENVIIQPMTLIQKHFGYFSPCPACHFLFHMIRIPIARHLGVNTIISGEREAHGTKLKLNQLPPLLDFFSEVVRSFRLELLQSIRYIEEDGEILMLLGRQWVNAAPYRCSFSGNYFDENNALYISPEKILTQLTEFYAPLFTFIVEFVEAKKKEPSREEIRKKIKEIIHGLIVD